MAEYLRPTIEMLSTHRTETYEGIAASYMREGLQVAFKENPSYHLFQTQDSGAWIFFSVFFVLLLAFDGFVLNQQAEKLSLFRALGYSLFWVCMACCFCGWVYVYLGSDKAAMWMSGYMLEWMLSFDNLFVFHLIFAYYGTPDHLKHRPLFIGICGAVFFRLAFIFAGEYLMHSMFIMKLLFGFFLVYTGAKTVLGDGDEDEDPLENPIVRWAHRTLPLVSAYDQSGKFFVSVPIDSEGRIALPKEQVNKIEAADVDEEDCPEVCKPREAQVKPSYGSVDFKAALTKVTRSENVEYQTRFTMLFLVVVSLEISDLIFAVDSVSAIVAQVNDLFLAYSSAIFAMLGLRATFFIIDVLVEMFTMLKYGVAAVLVFIGAKLMISPFVHIHPSTVCVVLFGCIVSSMVASVIWDKYGSEPAGVLDCNDCEDVEARLCILKEQQEKDVRNTTFTVN